MRHMLVTGMYIMYIHDSYTYTVYISYRYGMYALIILFGVHLDP